jgi:hypothetical protein
MGVARQSSEALVRVQRLPREPGQVWRAIGLAGVLLCAVEAVLDLIAYEPFQRIRGEQTALRMGLLMVLLWLMPLAASAVLMGAVPGHPWTPAPADRRRRTMVWLLRSGAVVCLLVGICLRAIEIRDPATGHDWTLLAGLSASFSVLLPATFAVLVWACAAVVLRPAASRAPWFKIVLEVCGVIEVVPVAVALSGTLPWTPDRETLARVGENLLWMSGPSLVLVAVIGRRLRILHRSADAIASA